MRDFNGFSYDSLSEGWIKNLIKNHEEEWQQYSDSELVRWLYIELGKEFSFNRKYRYAVTEKERNEIIERSSRNHCIDTDSVNCIEIEGILKKILNDIFLINADVIVDGSGPHVYLEVKTSDYGRIRMDLQEDLTNIKAGRKTEKFASESQYDGRYFMVIPSDDLREIDAKIGYISEDKQYRDEINIDEYKKIISREKTIKDKTEKTFEIIRKIYIDKIKKSNATKFGKNMKYCERTELYKKAISELYPENSIEHHTFRDGKKLQSCFTVTIEDGSKIHYLYNKDRNAYTQINNELYIKLFGKNNEIIEKACKEERSKGKTQYDE